MIVTRENRIVNSVEPLPTSMPALKKTAAGPGLDLVGNVPVPSPGPGQVLVRVTHAGICGTDRHIYEWDPWSASRVPVGITTGHEFVGHVVATAEPSRRTSVGERVSAEGHISCGSCHACRTGNAHICERVRILGVDMDGCFAPYVVVPEENLWKIGEEIPDHVAAIFDPLGNAMHTVMSAGVSGRAVLVTGSGIIGLMAIAIARAQGARTIVATDPDPRRRALALELGADAALDATDPDWPEEARRVAGGHGAEALLEMSGHPVAIRQGLRTLANGGTAALLGIPGRPIELDLASEVIFKGVTIHGVNGRRMFETWYQVEEFARTHVAEIERIVTHRLPFDRYEEGIHAMQTGDAVKVVLELDGLGA